MLNFKQILLNTFFHTLPPFTLFISYGITFKNGVTSDLLLVLQRNIKYSC